MKINFLVVFFILLNINLEAESLCESVDGIGGKITCYSILGVGFVVYATSEIKSAIMPNTQIRVRLSDGSIQDAEISQKVLGSRIVKKDDILDLHCHVNEKKYDYEYGYASCDLVFPRLPPHPEAIDYREKTGTQGSYGFGMNEEGMPDKSIMKLSKPIQWK